MGWERRRNGRLYYYRTHRIDRRVLKEYVGTGPAAVATAQADAECRAARARNRQAEQQRRDAYELAHGWLRVLRTEAQSILAEAMTASGFHRHDRGIWRKKREQAEQPSPD